MFTKRLTWPALLLAAAALAVAASPAAAEGQGNPQTLPVGVAKVDITPEYPVRMYGYASRKTESEGIAGRPKAKALAIGGDSGGGPAVLLTVDNGAVPVEIRAEVLARVNRKVSLKPGRFVLANAHNHSGPNLKGAGSMTGEHLRHIEQYAGELTDRLTQVVLEALASRRPGRLAWAQGEVAFAANRRVLKDGKWAGFGGVPGAPVDHSLPILRVTDAEGKLLAVVVNYACHCTTLRGKFMQIHGDWAGCAQKFIEADHPGAIAMITIGCGADADPWPHTAVELCALHGREVSGEVKRLLSGPLTPIEPKLSTRSARLEFPYLEPVALEDLKKRAEGSSSARALLERIERGEGPPEPFGYDIVTWTFGDDLAMVFLTGEVVVDYALRMKREMAGSRLWITAYSHDVPCYVSSKRLFGEGGYEVNSSISSKLSYGHPERVEPAIEDRIVGQVRRMLPQSFLGSGGEGGGE